MRSQRGTPGRPGRVRLCLWAWFSVTALALCAASVYMNVRSRSIAEAWGVADEKKIDLFSLDGKTILYYGPWGFSDARYPHWRKHPARPGALDDANQCWHAAGFAVGRGKVFPARSFQIEIPYWFWTLLSLAFTLWCTRRLYGNWQYARRGANGLCPTCGYDLRASPDRCPECGWPAKRSPMFVPSDEALARLGGGTGSMPATDDAPVQTGDDAMVERPPHSP